MRNSGKIALGIGIGLAVGSAIAYFADKKNRKAFVEGVSDLSEKTRDSIVEGYYEAKEKYFQYRDKLQRKAEAISDEAEALYEKGVKKAKELTNKAEDAIEKGVDKAKEVANKTIDKASEKLEKAEK